MSFFDDSQNSAPEGLHARKLGAAKKSSEPGQVAAKRFVDSLDCAEIAAQTQHAANIEAHRLQTELMQLMTSPAPGISAFPSADGNLLSWRATIEGPEDTPYSGLIFKLSFEFPTNYPYAPPKVLFRTPIYHPNIDFSGRICLDILKNKWTPAYNTQTVLLSLQSLLGEPNKYVTRSESFHAQASN
jgi:ubiquitin-conjugating enzyme E2 C